MKKQLIICTICLLTLLTVCSQNNSSRILSGTEATQLFTENVKKKYNIQYPIRRVYAYNDNSGEYWIALAERFDDVRKERYDNTLTTDTLHRQIKAFFFKLSGDTLMKIREMYDFVDDEEVSIWFWTKYCEFSDIDNDGLIEPIIIYGTSIDWFGEASRVKIFIYYKGKKYAIRHNNCSLDYCRSTKIDKGFYDLPKSIQERVKNIIRTIEENGNAYFGHWKDAMDKKKAKF